jgi:L-ascorbate metabolism protein UlaG (beta-lactamase superfamily)
MAAAGLGAAVIGLLAACATVNPYYEAAKPHHRPDGFNNRFIDNWAADQPSFWRWQRERLGADLPPQDPARVPRVPIDLAALRANRGDATVTWIGHSTMLWQVAGLNLLTDPHFTQRASPFDWIGPPREVPLPATLAELPRIDVVLISHNHYDHLDRATVRQLAAQPGGPPLFLVPLGVDLWLRAEGIDRVQRLDWWDRLELESPVGRVTAHFVPAQHWSSRTPWDRNATLWGGFVVEAWDRVPAEGAPLRLYHVGDTGYSPDFTEIGERFGGIDFAQIPVGCYLPRWFMQRQHVNEEEAVRIHRDVNSRFSVGVHWGTFRLCDDPVEAPLDGLPAARRAFGVADEAFVLLAIGETRVLRRASR